MGNMLRGKLRGVLAAAAALCLALSLVPAAALAEVASSAETTVTVEVRGSLRAAKVSTWSSPLSIADSHESAFDYDAGTIGPGVIWAEFEYGHPIERDGMKYYEASWVWEKTQQVGDDTVLSSGSSERRVNVHGTGAEPVAHLTMDEMFADKGWASDSKRPGDYAVTLTLKGDNCQASCTFSFTIVDAGDIVTWLKDEADGVEIWGAFTSTAELQAENLMSSTAPGAQATLTQMASAAAGKTIGAAFQLDIVGGGLFYDETPSHIQERVAFPVGPEIMAAAAANEPLALVVLVDGELTSVEYRYASGEYAYVSADGKSTLEVRPADALNPAAGGTALFAMRFTGASIGAVALAYAPARSYTIEVEVRGSGSGVVSPTAQAMAYGAGSSPVYAFSADAGCVLAGFEVLGASGPYDPAKIAITADAVRFASLDADARIVVTFDKYNPGPDPAPMTMSISQKGDSAALANSTIAASYTSLVGGEQKPASKAATARDFALSDVAPGTQVLFTINAAEGYLIEGAWVFGEGGSQSDATRVSVSGTTLAISAMTPDTAKVVVSYAKGVKPPAVRHTVRGVVDGGKGGSFEGMESLGGGRYAISVSDGDYQRIAVRAASGYGLARVVLYEGDAATGAGRELFADASAKAESFSYVIPSVACDCTVLAQFKEIEGAVVVPPDEPEASYAVTAKVSGGGGAIYPKGSMRVRAGSDLAFTIVPKAGYVVDKVTSNGHEVGLTKHEAGYSFFTARDIRSDLNIVARFKYAGDDAPVVTEQPIALTVKSVGFGTAYPSGTTKVAKGQPFTLTLEPRAGCSLKSLTRDGKDITDQVEHLAYTLPSVTSPATFVATFIDENGSTSGGDSGDVNIEVDIESGNSSKDGAQGGIVAFAENAFGDEIGGEVSPMRATIKPGATQTFIVKPYDGSYIADVSVTGSAEITEMGDLPMVGAGHAVDPDVDKPYRYVVVKGISGEVALDVRFDSCLNDPQNPGGKRYIYDQAAYSVVDVTPWTAGGVSVSYPDNSPEGIVPRAVPVIAWPGKAPIDHIEMLGHALDIEYGDAGAITGFVVDKGAEGERRFAADKASDACERLNELIDRELGYDPPRASGEDRGNGTGGRPDYVRPGADGSYELAIPTGNKEREPVEPAAGVSAGDTGGVLYQHLVEIGVTTEGGGTGGAVTVERNAHDLGSVASVVMNHRGELVVHASPKSGYAVRFVVDDASKDAIRPSEDTASATVLGSEEAPSVSASYTVTGPGKIGVVFTATGSTPPGEPGGPDEPSGPDATLGPADVAAGTAFAVRASAQGRGSISPSGTLYYRAGTAASFNLMPDSGYQVVAVSVDGKRIPWSATKYALADAQGGKSYTLVAEFSPASPAAGTISAGQRAIKTLQSLAQTGDLAAAGATLLTGVACAALGVVLLTSNRRRKQEVQEG